MLISLVGVSLIFLLLKIIKHVCNVASFFQAIKIIGINKKKQNLHVFPAPKIVFFFSLYSKQSIK